MGVVWRHGIMGIIDSWLGGWVDEWMDWKR